MRFIASLLLLCILVEETAAIFINALSQYLNRCEIQYSLSHSEGNLQTLYLTYEDLLSAIDGSELHLNGKMYDVSSIKKNEALYIVKVLPDNEEDELSDSLRKFFGKNSGLGHNFLKLLSGFPDYFIISKVEFNFLYYFWVELIHIVFLSEYTANRVMVFLPPEK